MSKKSEMNFIYMQKLREKRKMTQVRLSTKVGVSHQSIACYETNQRIPSLPVAYKIAETLGTSINGLFSDNIINKYYELDEEDKEIINKMIESLYNK
jgi:putative transcriptional regulator